MKLRAKSRRRLLVLLAGAIATLAMGAGAYGGLKAYRNRVWQEERANGLAAYAAHDAATTVRELGPYVQRHAGDVPALEAFAMALEQVPETNGINKSRALGTYERLVTLCPENLAYRLALTRLYGEACTWTMPANIEAIHSADDLMVRFGQQAGAQEAMAEALRVKIAALERLKKRADARSAIAQLQHIPPAAAPAEPEANEHNARATAALARLCEQESDDSAAEALYRLALQLDPALHPAENNLAMLLLRTGADLQEAQGLARAATAGVPPQAPYFDTLAVVLRAQEKPGEAEAAAAQAIRLDPANPEWRLTQAEALLDAHNPNLARQVLEEVATMPAALSPALRARFDAAVQRAASGPKATASEY